jgi:hypothetical protein
VLDPTKDGTQSLMCRSDLDGLRVVIPRPYLRPMPASPVGAALAAETFYTPR